MLISGLVVLVAGAVAVVMSQIGSSRPPARPPTPASSTPAHAGRVGAVTQPAQIPESADTTLVMWPVQADQSGGIYVDNLRTRRFWQPLAPAMDPGEFAPVLPVGRWIVWSDGAIHEVSATNPGQPRLLGKTMLFAPSVRPGHVLLQYGAFGHRQNFLRLVAVPSGQAGPPIDLPHGFEVIAGTKAGLLVQVNDGHLALWNPDAAPVTLPFSAVPYPVAASARLVAYDTGCRDVSTAASLPTYGNMGYPVCNTLRVYDVATGRLRSFAAPAGTLGWVPNRAGDGFWSFTDIAPSGRLMAAHAALSPVGRGIVRTFVLRLAGPASRPRPVPSSSAFLLSEMAWSAGGSLLFYQGPGAHLWAYRPATGRVWSSKTPCCNYEVLAPIGSSHH